MEGNFSMEYGMENFWYGMEMQWKKIARMEYGKIIFHFIPYHALLIISVAYGKVFTKCSPTCMQGWNESLLE